jgi:hypothetical protein
MNPSKRVQKAASFVATLLLFCGLSVAQEPKAKDWGNPVNGLQMRIYLDQTATGQSKVPRFKVELRNVGENDLLLNLGIMSRSGEQLYPTAVSLILVDSQRLLQLIELKRSLPDTAAEKETLYLPLPVGATFSFPVDLNNYWAVNSKEFDYKLKPGTYWLAAHLNGFSRTGQRFSATIPGQPAFVFVDASRMVTPQTALGTPPRSNTLQFEIPSR